MKNLIETCLVALMCVACEYTIPELPPETHGGANTFGCLVNGELVVPYSEGSIFHYNQPDLPSATYNSGTDQLQITAEGQYRQHFHFTVSAPKFGAVRTIDTVKYYPPMGKYYYVGNNTGEITFSYFNSIRKVVSGTFWFTGYKYDSESNQRTADNESVTVTLGRFDIKF